MPITISADDPRSIRAIEIAAEADLWRMYRDTDGFTAYGVPSQSEPGRYYLVTRSSCDCPDFERNGLADVAAGEAAEQRACKHMLAVRLYTELVRAQHLLARPRPSARARPPATRAGDPASVVQHSS